ncbi:hypothetical protein AFK65_17110 [Cronobacter universalis NCTC 9529]|uniref:Uncharacterized protein n=1 Tax=Cronobacter universalis NCTC 9529 TaxID=1074000 RepID=A0AAC8VSW3_9ENTR|nr:hypothetical protein AFK65_17110 [Cronobacter universalis NCTC 9529]
MGLSFLNGKISGQHNSSATSGKIILRQGGKVRDVSALTNARFTTRINQLERYNGTLARRSV